MSQQVRCESQRSSETNDLLPTGPGEERFTWPSINGPKRNWKPDPVQTSTGNLREILFRLQCTGFSKVLSGDKRLALTMNVL